MDDKKLEFEHVDQPPFDIQDFALDFVQKHPIITGGSVIALTAFIYYKAIELPIKNAIFKANKQTIDYIVNQARHI